jgi:hypothetical protein
MFHLPDQSEFFQVFTTSTRFVDNKATWKKPKCKMVYIICIGAGTPGGAGASGTSGVTRGGGGGGGAGSIAVGMFPSTLLPDQLYVVVQPPGGTGACLVYANSQNTATSDLIMGNGSAFNVGNVAASTTQTGVGGSVTIASGIYGLQGLIGIVQNKPAPAATSGGVISGGTGTNVVAFANSIIGPGAGGGSCSATDLSFNGGQITGAGRIPTILGGIAGGSLNGNNGITSVRPLFGCGGSGGASNALGTGGDGGDGGIGCGGGGGGGGLIGGNGGKGGPGACIIMCF